MSTSISPTCDRPNITIVTAMFTDIVDSTRLKGLMPAETAAGRDLAFSVNIKGPHDQRLFERVSGDGGQVVQSTGDGYLFTFGDAEQAVLCALGIQESLRQDPITTPLGPLQLRIGIHTGAVHQGGTVGGSAIDKAARVQASGTPGQVLISQETHMLVARLRGVNFEQMPVVELKGLGPEALVRVWREDTASRSDDRRLEAQLQRLSELENPYEFATTANHKTFKGRRQEMAELLSSIETGTHTAIFGLQRMGKTSLIEQGLAFELQSRASLRKGPLLATIDMQRLGGAQVTYKDFVNAIIAAILEQLNAHGLAREMTGLRLQADRLFTTNLYQKGDRTEFFTVFANVLGGLATKSQRRIVLFIDEFSEIRKVIERNRAALQKNPSRTGNLRPEQMYIDVPFINHLSSLLRDSSLKRQITFIVLARPFLAEYDEREGLQLLKLMKSISLRHLDAAAARELITEPVAPIISYEADAVDHLYRLTAGHPYLLQFMLKLIVDRLKQAGRSIVSITDIDYIRERMVSDGPAYDAQFAVLISDYSIDEVTVRQEARLGHGLLAIVSNLAEQESYAYRQQIFETMAKHKVPEEKTASLLSQMTRTCILQEDKFDGDLHYRLSIPLVQERFVRQNLYQRFFRRT